MCALSGHEVEVPGEVIRSPVGAEAAMLAVVGFQSGEVPLQAVGGGRDVRVVEDCHVVELLAMTNGRALLPLASLQSVNNLYGKYT